MTTKIFETDNEVLSLHIVTPTIDRVAQPKELLILIETPHTNKKDLVMRFNQRDANELLNEMKRLVKWIE